MKSKKTITFRQLRNEGLSCLDMAEKEVIHIFGTHKKGNTILHQDDLFHLLRMEEMFNEKILGKESKRTPYDGEKMMKDFESIKEKRHVLIEDNNNPSRIQLEIKKLKKTLEDQLSELENLLGDN